MVQLSVFLKIHLGGNFSLLRLNDREKRRNLQVFRKRVYLVTKEDNTKYVLYTFSPSYKQLFDNYILANHSLIGYANFPKWIIDYENFYILTDYLGEKVDRGDFYILSHYLAEINALDVRTVQFRVPRYISSLLTIDKQVIGCRYTSLHRLVERLGRITKFVGGYGIEDPALSNFVKLNNHLYLVDLDNFCLNVHRDYEFGFLIADIDLAGNNKLKSTVAELKKVSLNLSPYNLDVVQLTLGYLSRLATEILDFYQGECKEIKSKEFCINSLSNHLFFEKLL